MKKTKVKKYFTGGEMAGAMGGNPYSMIAQQTTDFANNLDTQQLANIGMNSNPYSNTQLKTSRDMRNTVNQQGLGAVKAGLSGKPGEAYSNIFNMGISALGNFQNKQRSGFSSGEDQQFVQGNQADIMQRNKMFNLADGGYLLPTKPVNTRVAPTQANLPFATSKTSPIQAPDRGNLGLMTPSMRGRNTSLPISSVDPQMAPLPTSATNPMQALSQRYSSNQFAGVPTSVPRDGSRQYSLDQIAGARQEQARNTGVQRYLTDAGMTTQSLQNQYPKMSQESLLQDYIGSDQGQMKLNQAMQGNYADGGMLNYFDGGFKHDDNNPDNVFEGIPQGMAPDNSMNVVEKGETKLGDYVFSDNLKVDKNLSKQFDIPKGKTFAAVSKKINKELLDRPNDTYTKATVEHNLQNLMQANDIARDMKEASNFKNGGRMNKYQGGGFTNSPEMEALIEKANNNPQSLTADERNIIQRLGDRVYQNYQENRPALFQDFPIFDPINPMLEYVTGNTPNMIDGEGNPIQGGGAPMGGFRAGNMGTRTLQGAKGSVQRNIPRQTFTPSGKPAFTKGRSKRKPVGDFDTNYDPLAGGRKASPDVIAKRQAAQRAKNLEKARAVKNEKAYQKLLDESSTVETGVNIPKELEGTVRFGNNNLSNIGLGAGYAGILGGSAYGASRLLENTGEDQDVLYTPNTQQQAVSESENISNQSQWGNISQADYMPFNYLNEDVVGANTQVPYRHGYAPEGYEQQQGRNYFDISRIFPEGAARQDSTQAIQTFMQNPSEFYGNADIGRNKVPWQKIEGAYAGGVNASIIQQANPELIAELFGDEWTGSQEQITALQDKIMDTRGMAEKVKLPEQRNFGEDWLRALQGGSPQLDLMQPRDTTLPVTPPDLSLVPNPTTIEEDKTSTTEETRRRKWPNLWPEAGMGAAMIPLPKAPKVAPTTISAGLLNPQLVDEQTMRANIDASNRANTGALANVTGGSGAAQRAGLLGAGKNYMDATGGAFLQANDLNNRARMETDRANMQNQIGIADINRQSLDQAEYFNKQAQYNRDLLQHDTRLGAFQDYTGTKYDHRKYRDANKIFTDFYGYNEEGLRTPMKSGGKLCVRKSLR